MTTTRALVLCTLVSLQASAGGLEEFMDRIDVSGRVDRNGFAAQVSSQFQVGSAEVKRVLGLVARPADAFMVFQVGRMTGKPFEAVLKTYQDGKGKDWEELAQELGLKPGSPEFQALKKGEFQFGMTRSPSGPGKPKGQGQG